MFRPTRFWIQAGPFSALSKPLNHFSQRIDPKRMFVRTRNQRQLLPACGEKSFPAAYSNFFQRFKTVRHERGTNDEHLFDAPLSEPGQFMIRVGSQPRMSSKARLESD